ncbi:MAG: family 10 glycosylhydrolase [Clostridia bacterium]|nr:family 10 glycosylhydrolase [Clostridia bacterium]
MLKLIAFLLSLIFGFTTQAPELVLSYRPMETTPAPAEEPYLRGVWLSQFDMQPIYRDGNQQREKEDYVDHITTLLAALKKDNFNTLFLQLRPNGDSMYQSEYYPLSKYVAGKYGGEITYDPVEILVTMAKEQGFAVHGWLNPLRLMTETEAASIPAGYAVKDWYTAGKGQVKVWEGRLYLDPSYPEARELICKGALEMLTKYDLDGIHMDDYFYPTKEEAFDREEFLRSGYDTPGDFRRANINALVASLYDTAHSRGKVYGVAPAGNLYSLREGYCADVEVWCKEGWVDYLMPQLYFGFENKYCPFPQILTDWGELVEGSNVKLYAGLAASKAVLARQGEIDAYAGTEAGKNEWIEHTDVLKRSLECLYAESRAFGYCFFSLSYLYHRDTGAVREEILPEHTAFAPLLREDA